MRQTNGSSLSGSASHPPDTRDGFVPAIESLRGVAALMVAGFHALIWLDVGGGARFLLVPLWRVDGGWQAFVTRALLVAFNGGAAVTLFFVLSGFVLHASLQRHFRERSALCAVSTFMALRVARLMPAYVASLLAMTALLWSIGELSPPPFAAGWLAWLRFPLPDASSLWAHLLLQRADINPVAWTLRIELLASMWLVGLYVLARWSSAVFLVGLAVMMVFSVPWPVEHVGRYLYLFALGLAASRWGLRALTLLMPSMRLLRAVLCLGVALVLLPGLWTLEHLLPVDGVSGVGAAMLLCTLSVTDQRITPRWLVHRVPRWLGRISYSFYLLHFPVLYGLCWLGLQLLPATWMQHAPLPVMLGVAMLALPLAAGIASIAFSCVEQPVLRWAHRAASRTCAAASAPRHRPR